ncbi:hypothetical protein HN51_045571 [Arachis hypogaea]
MRSPIILSAVTSNIEYNMRENCTICHQMQSGMHGEKLDQSKEHVKIKDLRERGYMEHGCQHYRRRCRIRAPCCNEIFHCRHCHNEAKDDIKIDPSLRHDIPRHQVKQVICSLWD